MAGSPQPDPDLELRMLADHDAVFVTNGTCDGRTVHMFGRPAIPGLPADIEAHLTVDCVWTPIGYIGDEP